MPLARFVSGIGLSESREESSRHLAMLEEFLGIETAVARDEHYLVAFGSLLKSDLFKAFLASPVDDFPVALIPKKIRLGFPNCRFLLLSARVAHKMAERHPDVTAKAYRRLWFVLMHGEEFQHEHDKDVRVFFCKARRDQWWRLVAWFPQHGTAAQIITYHRSSDRAYRHATRRRLGDNE